MGHGKGSRRQVLREPGTYSHGTGRIGAISKNNTPIVFIINDSCIGIGLRWRQCFGGPLRWHRSKSKKKVGRCSSEFVTCIARIRLDVMTREELGRGFFSIGMSNPPTYEHVFANTALQEYKQQQPKALQAIHDFFFNQGKNTALSTP
jgi:hypothetical protein